MEDECSAGAFGLGVVVAFMIALILLVTINVNTRANYELWHGEDHSRHAHIINCIIENPSDSLLVIDSKNPYPIGVIKFKRY